VLRYGLDSLGIQSRQAQAFPCFSDQPQDPPSLLHNGYWVFPEVKQLEHGANQSPPSSIAWFGAIPLPPFCTYIVMSLGDLFKVKSRKRPRKFLLPLYCSIGEVSLEFKVNTLIAHRETSYLYMSSVLNSIIKSQRFKVVGAQCTWEKRKCVQNVAQKTSL